MARRTRSSKSSPPVARKRALVGDEGSRGRAGVGISRDLVGRYAQLQLEARDRGVEPHAFGGVGARQDTAKDRVAIDERLHGHAGVKQDLAPERMERPDARRRRPPTPSGSTAASSRSVISSAARLLKVIARIASGGVPLSISHAARATSVVVLPDPAGATHNDGPAGAVAAARWSGASRASRRRPRDVRCPVARSPDFTSRLLRVHRTHRLETAATETRGSPITTALTSALS